MPALRLALKSGQDRYNKYMYENNDRDSYNSSVAVL